MERKLTCVWAQHVEFVKLLLRDGQDDGLHLVQGWRLAGVEVVPGGWGAVCYFFKCHDVLNHGPAIIVHHKLGIVNRYTLGVEDDKKNA